MSAPRRAALKAKDAAALSQNDLRKELLQRGMEPSGFWEDDMKTLQKVFDREYNKLLSEEQERMKEEASKKSKEQHEKAKKRAAQREIFEEEDALAKRPDIECWMHLVSSGQSGADAVLNVKPVLARHIAKTLPATSNLLSFDLSRNKIDDKVGVHLGDMLKRNKSLIKLELMENELGPSSTIALADALCTNTKLKYLGLEGNPLTRGQKDFTGAEAIAKMITRNKTLTTLNLRRTGIGVDGGRAIADAVGRNDTLIILDLEPTSTATNIELSDLQVKWLPFERARF